MRRVLAGASLVLAAAFLSSCGDDAEDAPDNASQEDFCEAMQDIPTDSEPNEDDINDWLDGMRDTGTPEEMSDDEREGFEIFIDAAEDADPEDFDSSSGLDDFIDDEDDLAKVTAFLTYAGTACFSAPEE